MSLLRLDGDGDGGLFTGALVFLYLACPLTILSLQFQTAPYGKNARYDGWWRPTVPPALAWFVMESPTLWLTILIYPHGRHASHPLALIVLSVYLLHYIHRALIYPLRLLNKSKTSSSAPFPVFIALAFNLLNAYLQARSASHYAAYPPLISTSSLARVAAGSAILFWGMAVNMRSDLALLRLRGGGGGYKVPRGGWFELVACPNYMGEAAEWLGWAVLAWSPAALAFFFYTCSNLGPRASAHLQWYRNKFGDEYPHSRKAILPFIY